MLNSMKRIFFVMGEGSVGKSTLIRCLTGIRQASRRSIRIAPGVDVPMWVWMRSMQELNPIMNPNDVLTDIFAPGEASFEYYLIPLRMRSLYGYPPAQDYIDLLGQRCTIMGAVALSADATFIPLTLPVPLITIPFSKNNPANANAATVRAGWGWI